MPDPLAPQRQVLNWKTGKPQQAESGRECEPAAAPKPIDANRYLHTELFKTLPESTVCNKQIPLRPCNTDLCIGFGEYMTVIYMYVYIYIYIWTPKAKAISPGL